jgi:hypothetical protein
LVLSALFVIKLAYFLDTTRGVGAADPTPLFFERVLHEPFPSDPACTPPNLLKSSSA